MAARGCGHRVAGGIYAEVPTDPAGTLTVESFLTDPPVPVDMGASGWHKVGVNVIAQGILHHLVDWVGGENYENVTDFIEEARRLGISRRLGKRTDFKLLTPGSRLLLVHARAYIENFSEFYARTDWTCPKHLARHGVGKPTEMCIGLNWESVNGLYCADPKEREGVRMFPPGVDDWSYLARKTPKGVTPTYRDAVFMSLPIRKLTVIRDNLAAQHDEALARAQESGLPVTLEDA